MISRPASPLLALAAVSMLLFGCGPDDGLEFGTQGVGRRPAGCPISSTDPECTSDAAPGRDASADPDSAVRPDGSGEPRRDGGQPGEDAQRECPPEVRCQGNCNGDDGSDYARCVAAGNRRGCTDEVFRGWCLRRVGDGLSWMSATREFAGMSCDGTVSLERGSDGYDAWVCRSRDGCSIRRCSTPIVLVFEGDMPVALRRDDGRAHFDLAARGEPSAERTDWPSAATPWLALDRDGDGRITSGEELFGSATPLASGHAQDGFEALADLDANHDGRIDDRDSGFRQLVVWFDRDGDRVSNAGELQSLASLGVRSLDLTYRSSPRCDARGNCEVERAEFAWTDPTGRVRTGTMVDVHLAVN